MTVRKLSSALFFALVSFALSAQETAPTGTYRSFSPADQWELGVDLGTPFIVGDIDAKFPGIGGGLHFRKSFDHIFSLRFGANYFQTENDEAPRNSENTWVSGNAQLVVAVNNFRFNKPYRKVLINVFGGIGVDNYSTDYKNITQDAGAPASGSLDATTNGHLELGAGLAFRVGPKFNIGLEHTVYTVFGGNADLLDSDENVGRSVTTFKDVLQFPHLSLNFNLGGTDKKSGLKKSEPLYWANPLSMVSDAITALEARPIYDPTDTDGDGIIDAIDDEDNSPAGARVDTKGVTADSDADKVPDYKDKEPYSPPGYAVDAMGVAQGLPKYTTEGDVNRIVDAKIAAIKFPEPKTNDWFFPSANFAYNSYALRYSEYEKLYQVATVLKQNPTIKVVAIGNTDRSGSEGYNNVLSYNRAKAAIDFLVSQHGIDRSRLILNWAGEGSAVVPVNGSNSANRRVEFRVAKGETEMGRPEGPEAGKGGKMKGNKDAGY
ncbi:MAG TPA: OmpA family protein [Saprospiraceae bacterium]|nr:OmpA family protein [Saprospiraceae bacterium]